LVLQRVAVCCSVVIAVCCSVVVACCNTLDATNVTNAPHCSVLQCVLQHVAVCVAACCSVLQCCCHLLQYLEYGKSHERFPIQGLLITTPNASLLQCVAACVALCFAECVALCAAGYCRVVAVCVAVCIAVCCSMLQCVAELLQCCCNTLVVTNDTNASQSEGCSSRLQPYMLHLTFFFFWSVYRSS